jgi:NitT/TauT family transport system substrate-binding protein
MTFRPVATSFGVGFFLAALAIAGSLAAAQTAPLNPRVAIKVGAIGAVSDAGIFIAQEKGYFKDEGLDVELVSFKAAPQILPAIATGEVQVSGSAVTPALFNAFARGIGMKLVADKGQVAKGFGFAAIVIRSDLTDTVKDFKDLKGRKFAVMGKGVSSTAQLGKALELGGIEPSEVEFVELGLPEMVAALGNKAIDGATLLEPFITLATARNVAVRWKGMEDFLPFTGQNGVIIYSQKFAEEQGEAAKRWMVAYLKGTRPTRCRHQRGRSRRRQRDPSQAYRGQGRLLARADRAHGIRSERTTGDQESRSRPGLVPQARPAAGTRRPRPRHRLSILGLCRIAAGQTLSRGCGQVLAPTCAKTLACAQDRRGGACSR